MSSTSKRGIAGALAVALLGGGIALAAPQTASAATVSTTIDGISYTADDADPGAGATVSFSFPTSTAVDIPDSVTIAGQAYPVTAIADYALDGRGLTAVTLPDTLVSIGVSAFDSDALTAVTIPDSVTSIGEAAFELNQLTQVTLGSGLTEIPAFAFYMNRLAAVALPSGVTTIDSCAFCDNALTTVEVPAGVTDIENSGFGDNPLTAVTIDGHLATLGHYAFYDGSATPTLASVTFLGDAPDSAGTASLYSPLGFGDGLTVYYPSGAAGDFSSPTWHEYQAVPMSTATFDANGGTGTMTSQRGSTPTALPADAFTRAGYDFAGWSTAADGSGTAYADGAVFPFASDATLYAQWTPAASTGGGGNGTGSGNGGGTGSDAGGGSAGNGDSGTAGSGDPGSPAAALADTGTAPALPLGAGLAALVLGAILLMIRARRRAR